MPPTANCPVCHASLALTDHGSFNSWVCPAGHGLAATLSELYEVTADDEIHGLWAAARQAPAPAADARHCPMCDRAMVTVSTATAAEAASHAVGDLPVDVCVADEVVWFDAGELEQLPADVPDAVPTAEEDAHLAQIRQAFGDDLVAAHADEADGLGDRIARRVFASRKTFGLFAPRTPTH